MMRSTIVFALISLAALPARADLRPAPNYFMDVTFATTTAQALAQSCPTLSFELLRASRASGDVMSRLSADGFDLDNIAEQMIDPTPAFDALRDAFLLQHGLSDGAAIEDVCRAGHSEVKAGSAIGSYLTVVAP